ncbi:hypothetical protein G9E11_15375 [Arthrobacter sp. IA7]|nr:hypothetical protein [Arthrobacter ipis]MBD1543592.1 hypothetical protein [Arthrobacter ipis]
MTSDDEKDPPVPADLVDAPKRIHHDQVAEEHDRPDHTPLADEPND